MLHELITYAVTRCPPFARGMGYLYEAVAMQARHGRHRDAWLPHAERSRQFVLSEAGKCPGHDRAVVIGSGLLLDLPLRELSSMFREVVLVDVVFLPMVRRQARSHGNVRMVEHDVTGAAEMLYQNVRCGRPSLPGIAPSFPGIVNESGLVVSLNVMSQLSVIPERYILKKMAGVGGEAVDAWCGELASSHYQALRALPCAVSLITDFSFTTRDPGGTIVERGDTLRGVALPAPDESWTWDIAPLGEYSRHFSKELTVGAWHIR